MILLLSVGSIEAQDRLYADEFPIGDITLLDGPLKKARDLNIQTLLQYDCDRLLAPYLKDWKDTWEVTTLRRWLLMLQLLAMRSAVGVWNI